MIRMIIMIDPRQDPLHLGSSPISCNYQSNAMRSRTNFCSACGEARLIIITVIIVIVIPGLPYQQIGPPFPPWLTPLFKSKTSESERIINNAYMQHQSGYVPPCPDFAAGFPPFPLPQSRIIPAVSDKGRLTACHNTWPLTLLPRAGDKPCYGWFAPSKATTASSAFTCPSRQVGTYLTLPLFTLRIVLPL